jgi:hypothetical protein
MIQRNSKLAMITTAVLLVPCASASGDVPQNLAAGLGLTGFQLSAGRNPISGGIDANLFNNFPGSSIDFGAGDITLGGPVSLAVSTGGRLMPTLDISLSTAINADAAPQLLSYVYNYDPGSQSTLITGNLFIDADFSINRLGFYDLDLTYSSRQTVERDGRFANDETNNDIDLGPINVSGNIFADVLAAFTQPFYDQTGGTNPFASFSGSAKLAQLTLEYQQGTGQPSNASIASALSVGADSLSASAQPFGNAPIANVVPEPTVLVLLLAGLPAILRRRRVTQ